ncbi:single-stranded DNA-binding protein [bacterium]|nr:single-stranded DNA-binding protein [bacterium]
MNRLAIVGRAIADPEIRTVGERLVATIPISVNRPYKRKEATYPESDVFRIEVWGPRGESLVNHVSKGTHLWATGRVELRKAETGGYYVDVRDADWGFAGAKAVSSVPEADKEAEALPF